MKTSARHLKSRCLFASITWLLSLTAAAPSQAVEGEPQLLQLYQYKPIYFLVGNPYAKIELSFKTQIVSTVPFYFAYTQLMFWDIFTHSPYFQDLNYNPLIFYRLTIDQDHEQWLDLIPLEHESNGRGGDDERSWNRIGAAYHFRTRLNDKAMFYGNLKAWVPLYINPNNSDIAQYRGVWEVEFAAENFLGSFFEFDDLTFRLYPGGASVTNPLKGGQELTFRTKSAYRTFLPVFVGQIFHGYAESLIVYNEERWGFRAGFGF